ncbi:RING-H2 finger protein ATL47 [Striga hermonthica]|uniref:RING-type E3 ubiquitin transferase n=1 Tax=Striga hermonthica TaxID=68872 RepID=A0A9N7N4D7_STRHE|nr:RING-H2 finger protein ATL47 [Striga hermonthica]
MSRISPIVLLSIVILAIAFFALGLLQLLIRCLIKRPSFSLNSQSIRSNNQDSNNPHTFQRQLQHLFRLHDSGLERALIDALPVFHYRDIMGLKEPFDCAVCLSEFSADDKLKFLPKCSHAFHIHCIETWLLSNSTCPLCRSLIGNSINSPSLNFGGSVENRNLSRSGSMVLSVRLGKFRNSNEISECEDKTSVEVSNSIDISNTIIGARRCYSMGAFQYIVDNDDLRVALPNGGSVGANGKARGTMTISDDNNVEIEGKRISSRSRGDSFSVSKIWLWSKKGKFSSLLNEGESSVLPMPNGRSLV